STSYFPSPRSVTMTPLRLVSNDPDSLPYLRELSRRQLEPLLVIEPDLLKQDLQTAGGVAAFSVPDPHRTHQVNLPLYIGFTTPQNSRETPHWHADQAEAYYLVSGEAEIWGKHRWDDDGWVVRRVPAGRLIVAQPGVCHYF